MPEYTKQYKFTEDTRCNLNTSYTIDDSICYLMGNDQGLLREISHHSEDPDGYGELSYGDIVKLQQEEAQAEYVEAKSARARQRKGKSDVDDIEITDDQFAEIESALNSATEKLAKYHKFRCDIVDELAKGSMSELRIDQNNTKYIAYPYITISSLKAWEKSKYPDSAATPQKKPARTKMLQREDAILDAIRQLEHEPTRLPEMDSGNRWVKSYVWDLLKGNLLFINKETLDDRKAFDNAWAELNSKQLISVSKKVSPLQK